jgi:aryl-alcohol dehydrogenase-like predicted oxidoreductase
MLAAAADLRMQTDAFTHEFFGDEVDQAIVRLVADLARRHGVSPAEVAMSWVVHSGRVDCPLIGASTLLELETAVGAADLQLSPDEHAWLETLYRPADVINDHQPVRRRRALPAELRGDD